MDDYRPLIKNLGCQLFSELNQQRENTVVKIAFVIESMKIKVSKKNQKKFVILIISDGTDRIHLPIWSNMYEENNHLLHENQLLFSLLQIERNGTETKFRCRLLKDLTLINEEDFAKLSQLYEQMKKTARSDNAGAKEKKHRELSMNKEKEKTLAITLDANLIRLSEILKIKSLFYKHPGVSPISIVFQSDEKKIGTITIDSKQGVSWSLELEKQLKTLPFIQSFAVNY